MPKLTLDDCVFLCMRNGQWWTFWELQKVIKQKSGVFYGEPSISAAIRNLSKQPAREKYKLPALGEVYEKKRRSSGNGYKYKLIGEKNG